LSSLFYTDSGKGFPVVFIHGFCESHEIWSDFIIPFTENFRVLTIDLPGFGKSPLPDSDISIDFIGKQVIDWLDELQISQTILIGHSLGGYVTLSIANQRPDLLKGFVLFHSTCYPDSEAKKANRNKVIKFISDRGTAPYIKVYVPSLLKNKNHSLIAKLNEMALPVPATTLIKYLEAMRDRSSQKDVLTYFLKPILFIAGVTDEVTPFHTIKEQADLAQMPSFTLLEESCHLGMLEEKAISQVIVRNFLLIVLPPENHIG
jgi:pimeloyl-ACP methyl ester carboxylesterase